MGPIPVYGQHITLETFIWWCNNGMVIDDDGLGNYATDTQISEELAIPSDICRNIINRKYTHVVWFNR